MEKNAALHGTIRIRQRSTCFFRNKACGQNINRQIHMQPSWGRSWEIDGISFQQIKTEIRSRN